MQKQFKNLKLQPKAGKVQPNAEKVQPNAGKVQPNAGKVQPDAENYFSAFGCQFLSCHKGSNKKRTYCKNL